MFIVCSVVSLIHYNYSFTYTFDRSQHRPVDLLLAAIETIITFSIAYPAAVVQGAVLLQTSPTRGMPGGRMEAFLRTMREVCKYSCIKLSKLTSH